MSLLRFAARSMLASYFVVSGARAVVKPGPIAEEAESTVNAVVPAVKKIAPVAVGARIPEDPATLVRLTGAVQVAGGLALATGLGRRLGALALAASLVPSTLVRHPFWSRTDPSVRAADRTAFLKNVALTGGVLIAAGDTEGRPGLAWRVAQGKRAVASGASRQVDEAGKAIRRGGRRLRREAKLKAREAKRAATQLTGIS